MSQPDRRTRRKILAVAVSAGLAALAGACVVNTHETGAPAVPPPAALPPAPEEPRPACVAADMQYLVGHDAEVLTRVRFGVRVRIELPGQAYTQEYDPSRVRILVGPDNRIVSVLCG